MTARTTTDSQQSQGSESRDHRFIQTEAEQQDFQHWISSLIDIIPAF